MLLHRVCGSAVRLLVSWWWILDQRLSSDFNHTFLTLTPSSSATFVRSGTNFAAVVLMFFNWWFFYNVCVVFCFNKILHAIFSCADHTRNRLPLCNRNEKSWILKSDAAVHVVSLNALLYHVFTKTYFDFNLIPKLTYKERWRLKLWSSRCSEFH